MVSVLDHLSAGSILLPLAIRSDSWTWPVAYGVAVFVVSAAVVLVLRAREAVAMSMAPCEVVDADAPTAAEYAVVGAPIGADVGVGWGAPGGRELRTRRRPSR